MAWAFTALLIVIFVAVIAMLGREGLWSNAIMLSNVIIAALLATNFWEPLASKLNSWQGRATYLWDLAALWVVFALALGILRGVSDYVSRVNVRFPKLVEVAGGYVVAAAIGWAMVSFTTMTLHTAPLAREFMWGGFKAEDRMLLGLAPDRKWLGFMQAVSRGAFAPHNAQGHVFDPRDFMVKYATRREKYEAESDTLAR